MDGPAERPFPDVPHRAPIFTRAVAPFLEEEFRRIGTASIPWALLRSFESDGTPHRPGDEPHPPRALAAGVVMTAAAVVLPAAALAIFVLSNRDMSGVGHDAASAGEHEALTSDFESIRRMTEGHPVYMSWDDPFSAPGLRQPFPLLYYLARSHLRPGRLRQEHRPRRRAAGGPDREEKDRLQHERPSAVP